jgi:pimeloyl-ACP methyl ester carboxylesterase
MLSFRRYGRGAPLVLVHGFLGGAGYWVPQLAHFGASFDVIAVDLPGFAASHAEPAQESIEGFAAAVLDLADRLQLPRFCLIGHSMGGMIAQRMTLDHGHRIDRLVLYGTAATGELPHRFETFEESIARLAAIGIEAGGRKIVQSWFVAGEASPFYPLCWEAGLGLTTDAAIKALRAIMKWNARGRLRELKVPTLVISGDRDRSTPPTESLALWQGIEGAQLCIVPGCAHAVHLERPALFNDVVGSFLVASAGGER